MGLAERLCQLDAENALLEFAHTRQPAIAFGCLHHHVLSNLGVGKNKEGFVADYLHAHVGNFGWLEHCTSHAHHVS